MKHYLNKKTNQIFAYEEDGSQDQCITEDLVLIDDATLKAMLAVTETTEQILAKFTFAIQKHLDDTAKTRGYDSILSACTYANSSIAKFSTEGQACVTWRDRVWDAAYTILTAVKEGTSPMPASNEALLLMLPAITW